MTAVASDVKRSVTLKKGGLAYFTLSLMLENIPSPTIIARCQVAEDADPGSQVRRSASAGRTLRMRMH